jgi:hypothetical protein
MLTSRFHPKPTFSQSAICRSFVSRRRQRDTFRQRDIFHHRKPSTPRTKLKDVVPEPNPNETPTPADAVSNALRDTNAVDNNLLAPVHIPEDPDGVLNEKHPAVHILVGFEQANKYVIMDPQGNHLGFIVERDLGLGNMMARQMFSTHRSFTTHVFDKFEKEVLRVRVCYGRLFLEC